MKSIEPNYLSINKQAWIFSPKIDLIFILAPAFICTLIVFLLQQKINISGWEWLILVVGIDVAHVYSTLFISYWNESTFKQNKQLFILLPLGIWLISILIYSINWLLFWQCLAYIAVFHFVRQQYGFMSIYSRQETNTKYNYKILDTVLIYSCTLYPIIYWHTHLPRKFNWFLEGDFIQILPRNTDKFFLIFFVFILLIYILKEIILLIKYKYFNIPKNLIITGTILSWWAGIVIFNSDFAFSLTNIVAHGIPYMALTYFHKAKSNKQIPKSIINILFSVFCFLIIIWLLAYLEEGFWDIFIWQENKALFPWFSVFSFLPKISEEFIIILVTLLALPQLTHYILDGFIWTKSEFKPNYD